MATPKMIVDEKQSQTDEWSGINAAEIGELFQEYQIQLSAALDNIRAADVEDAFGTFVAGAAPGGSTPSALVSVPEPFLPETAIPASDLSETTARAMHVQRQPGVVPLQAPKRLTWIVFGSSALLIIVFIGIVNHFSQTTSTDTNTPSVALNHIDHAAKGDKYASQNEWAKAAQEHGEAAQLDPDNARWHNKLGNDLFRLSKYTEAVEAHRNAVRLEPNSAQMHSDLGKALIWTNKWAEAAQEHERAVQLEPDNAQWHNNLGVDLMWMGKPAQAKAEYKEALRLDPQNLEYQNNFKTIEYLSGRWNIVAH